MRFRSLILPLVLLRDALNSMARSPFRAFVIIFALSFAIRGTLLFSGLFRLRPDPVHETGHVGVSLACSGRFADPYQIPTGLTAHPTPICTGILGLIYRGFGMTVTAGGLCRFLSGSSA